MNPRIALRVLTLGACAIALGVSATPADDEEPRKPRALIVTGEDVPAHVWRETTPVTREILDDAGFDVRVSEDVGILEASTIHEYDVLILNFRNNFRVRDISSEGRRSLMAYLDAGKGVVALHFAVAALQNWPEYRDVIGRVWVPKKSGHGPRGPFKATIATTEHPITQGLEDFEIDDELYARLEGEAPIEVLVRAHSEWSGADEPLVWTVPRERGRVACIALGHDARARRSAAFTALLVRTAAWAAVGPARGE